MGQAHRLMMVSVAGKEREHLAGDVALQDSHDLGFRFAVGGAPLDVDACARIAAHAGQCNAPEGVVGLAVTAPVQPVAGDFA